MNSGKRKYDEKSRKSHQPNTKTRKLTDKDDKEDGSLWFDLKEAKKDIRKFGIAGMSEESKKLATINMLVELGAKPPKKKYINYKTLQEMKKEEKSSNPVQIQKAKKKQTPRDVNKVKGSVDGQIGTFKDGYLKLDQSQLKMFKNSSKRKSKPLTIKL